MQVRRPLCLVALAFVLTIMAMVYTDGTPAPSFDRLEGDNVILAGQVDRIEYRMTQPSGQLRMVLTIQNAVFDDHADESVRQKKGQTEQPEQGYKVLCYFQEETPEPKIGQWIKVQGKFQQFSQATNPGEFDSRSYYQILNLSFRLKNTSILATSRDYSIYQNSLYQIRKSLAQTLDRSMPSEDAAVLKTMLLGDKSTLTAETKELYQDSGIIHILAISGLHISILGMGFYRLLKKLYCPRWPAALLAIAVILSYGIMTGLGASSMRAVCMFAVHLFGELAGRTYDMVTALSLMAILMLLQQPLWVRHSGFLLSFGAIVAIGIFLPVWKELWESSNEAGGETGKERASGKKPESRIEESKIRISRMLESRILGSEAQKELRGKLRGVWDGFLAGSAVSVVTLPILLYFYAVFPIYSMLLNLIVIPLMTLVVIDGISVMAIGRLSIWLAQFAGAPGQAILELYRNCCEASLRLPGARIVLGQPRAWQILLYYLLLTMLVIDKRKIPLILRRMLIIAALAILCVRPHDGLGLSFLDVGQGDCIVLQNDNGNCYMIDGGSTTKTDVGAYQIIPFLKSQAVARLSGVFLSHPDADHINGAITVLEQSKENGIKVDCLILPDVADTIKKKELLELRMLAGQSGIPVRYLKRGDYIRDGNLELLCLNPQEEMQTSEINEISEVLLLRYKSFSALLTGDVTGTAEEGVIARLQQLEKVSPGTASIDVLKVAHHGSQYSTPASLLELTQPKLAVISAGKQNRYGHPHRALLQRLERAEVPWLNTMQSGAVTLKVRGKSIAVETFLP